MKCVLFCIFEFKFTNKNLFRNTFIGKKINIFTYCLI